MKGQITIGCKKLATYEPPIIYITLIDLEQGIAAGSAPAEFQPGEPTDVEHEWKENFVEEREVQW